MRQTSDYFDYLFLGSLIVLVFTLYAKGFNKRGATSIGKPAVDNVDWVDINMKLVVKSAFFWLSLCGVVFSMIMSIITNYYYKN